MRLSLILQVYCDLNGYDFKSIQRRYKFLRDALYNMEQIRANNDIQGSFRKDIEKAYKLLRSAYDMFFDERYITAYMDIRNCLFNIKKTRAFYITGGGSE